jgi:two-component system chemotaxis family response regulator WspR
MSESTSRAERGELARRMDRAEKLLQKGKAGDALEEYLQLLRDDPQNDKVRELAADLCLSQHRGQDAVRLLGELFERQISAGDATRASLIYKKLVRQGNPTWEQKVLFGRLLEGSNKKLSASTYELAFDELMKLEKKKDGLKVLGRVVALEPSRANLLRLGELSSELGDRQTSATAFKRAAQLTAEQGEDPAQWYERAYQEDSADEEIALSYGKSLLGQGQVGAAIFILEPQVSAGKKSPQLRDIYAEALLAAGRYADAEPIVWQLFEENPDRMTQVTDLIGQLVDAGQDYGAVSLARKLGQFQSKRGERRQFLGVMEEIASTRRASAGMLEFLGELFNAANREGDYCRTLLRLFEVYSSAGNFAKAADCLERAAEVDPYESGHAERLEKLKGRIDEKKFNTISSRFNTASSVTVEPAREREATLGAGTLQDLMLQAEILVQYGMRTKAVERLQRIQELFPREEERNEDLQRLYLSAGIAPSYAGSASRPEVPAGEGAATGAQADAGAEMRNVTRVAEITRKLYHQTTAPAVLTTAVREIGEHWQVSRCVAAMRAPGSSPSALQEFCGKGIQEGSSAALKEVMCALHDLVLAGAPGEAVIVSDALSAKELKAARNAMAELGASAVMALPLSDGEEPVGVLALLHHKPRTWPQTDAVVLKSLADQMVIALNNAGLRRLVKNLSVTDEKSGLLKRGSYLDLLLAESRRAMQNAAPLSVLLIQFGRSAALLKEHGEATIEGVMEKIGQQFAANIRTNDLAFRYDTTTIAIVLGDTAEKEALLVAEKLRKTIAGVRLPGKEGAGNASGSASEKGPAMEFSAGLAQAVIQNNYDPIDIVTEVINRAEFALATSTAQGPGKVVALGAALAAGAVA